MTIRPEIKMTRFLSVDEGRQLELSYEIGESFWQLASVVAADNDESLWFQIHMDERIVQIPLQVVEALIEAAKTEVHSETWFEQNVYPYFEQEQQGAE